MKYFKNVTGFSDLKQQYRTLLKANHPDNGGDEEVMKAINMEYDVLFPVWKSREESETETVINETSSSTRRRFYTEFGWEGSRYNSELSLKEIAQIVRAYVKEKYPTYKFSVRTSYASMCQELHVELKESPIPVYKPFDELTSDDFDNLAKALFRYDSDKQIEFLNAPREEQKKIIESSESYDAKILNEITCAVVEDVDAFVKSYNYNDSDGMIDYFDVNFYYFGCCRNNGGNISIVPKTARFSENKNNLKRKNAGNENADESINVEKEPAKEETPTEQPENNFPTHVHNAEPTVTILWSEHDRFHDGETMSLSEANAIIENIDKATVSEVRYYKTKFRIDFVMNGHPDNYIGRQDLGDGDGTLIDHIEKYHTYYENNAEWDNWVLHNDGREALEADKAQREMLLHEFVPYLKLHNNLSNMERITTEALRENGNMTPAKTAYYTAMQEYIFKCRTMVNSGDYDLPLAPQLKDFEFDTELAVYKEHVKEEIAQEAAAAGMSVEEYAANDYEPYAAEMPDSSVSINDMKEYGYTWDGMLPLKETSALQLYKKEIFQIFLLYEDGSESVAESAEDIKKHADRGGILGIHKEDWNKFIEPKPMYYVQKEDIENNESNVHELRVVYSRMSEEPDFDEITDPMVHMGYTLYRGSFEQCMDYMDKLNKREITEEQIKTDNQDNFPKKIFYYAIDESAARRAKEANSFSDYKPGSATEEYRQMVDKAVEIAEQQKKRVDPMYHEKIDSLVDTYARKLAENMNSRFSIDASVPSVLIAGGSNFPAHKKERQNAARDRNLEEWNEIQGLLDRIRSTGMGGISADDPHAVQKLEAKLKNLLEAQETMKAVNAYYRENNTLEGCTVLSAESIGKLKKEMSSQWHFKDIPYPSWALSNNSAEIRRVKERIAELTRKNQNPYAGWEFDGGRVEANLEDNRLRIIFDKKPDEDIREGLKRNGFRWSPKNMAWQRQLNDNAIYAADRLQFIYPLSGKSPSEIQKEARYEDIVNQDKIQKSLQSNFEGDKEILRTRRGR